MKKDLCTLIVCIGVLLLIIAILPIILPTASILLANRSPSISTTEINTSDLLSFWGSIIGGCIGGIAALLTVCFSIKYYNKKDMQMRYLNVYNRQIEKIEAIIHLIHNREIVLFDYTNTFNLTKPLLQEINDYNEITCILKGFYTEYAIQIFQGFYGLGEKNEDGTLQKVLGIDFLNLKPEFREFAETVGKLALYENAKELLHGDARISYILESEAGGSVGLWATGLHDKDYAFKNDDYHYEMLQKYFPLVEKLLVDLEDFKESEYARIVNQKNTGVKPRYRLKKQDGHYLGSQKNIVIDVNNEQHN